MAGKKRVLIVDDEIEFAESLGFLLAHENYEVDWAFDGFQAVERLLELPFDIVIADNLMPNMTGIQLAGMFAGPSGSSYQFIILANNQATIDPNAVPENVLAVLPKIFEISVICRIIEKVKDEPDGYPLAG